MNRLLAHLKDLTEIAAPSGHETPVAERIARELEPVARSIEIDRLGNLVVEIGNPSAPTVIIDAHMDEVGLVVRRIDSEGNVLFDKLGVIDDRVLPAREVDIIARDGLIRGVIGIKGRHLLTAAELAQHPEARSMWIETGLSKEELEQAGVGPGAGISFTTRFQHLANGVILGKSLDCRIGCAVAAETVLQLAEAGSDTLQRLNVMAVFTVQEEIGAKGAAVVAHGRDAEMAIVLDTVPCEDPIVAPDARAVQLGGGPVLRMFDFYPQTMYGSYTHPRLRELMIETAKAAGVPYQIDIMTSTWLDSATLSRTGPGIPTASVCFPRRYAHSPTEVAHALDAENAVRLLIRVVERAAEGIEFKRKLK